MTAGVNGLGLNPIPTLDWNRFAIDPFVTPFFTNVNFFVGMLAVGLFFMLPMYLNNVWYSGHLPFNMNRPFDRFGKRYNISRIVDTRGRRD